MPVALTYPGEAEHKLELPHMAKESAGSGDVPRTPPSLGADLSKQLSGITHCPVLPYSKFPGEIPVLMHTPPHQTPPIHELKQERQGAPATHQREVVRVNPDNTQVGIIGVVPGNLLQDFQELKPI